MKVLSKHTHPLIPHLLTNCSASRVMTRTREQTVTNRFSPGTAYSIYIMNKVNGHPDLSVIIQVELMVVFTAVLSHSLWNNLLLPQRHSVNIRQYRVSKLFIMVYTVDSLTNFFTCLTLHKAQVKLSCPLTSVSQHIVCQMYIIR